MAMDKRIVAVTAVAVWMMIVSMAAAQCGCSAVAYAAGLHLVLRPGVYVLLCAGLHVVLRPGVYVVLCPRVYVVLCPRVYVLLRA